MLGFLDSTDLIYFAYHLYTKIIKLKKEKMLSDEYATNLAIPSNEQTAIFTGDLPYPLNTGQCVDIIGIPAKECNRYVRNNHNRNNSK